MKPNITFKAVDPKHGPVVTAELGDGFAVPTTTGGWQIVSRPRRRGITDFQGADPISMDIPILLGPDADKSVESDVARLFQMMREQVGSRNEPAVIRITGVPIPFIKAYDWVINNIAAGAEIRRSRDGHRVQAAMTVTVLEYVAGDVLTKNGTKKHSGKSSPAKRSGGKGDGSGKVKVYTVKAGDTLEKIAAKEYGNSSEWHRIAKANNLRSPNSIHPGQKLKIPS